MMRRYHRWLALIFGAFMIWISATGVLSHVGEIVNNGGLENEAERRREAGLPEADAPALPAGFVCPENFTCRPTPPKREGAWDLHELHELHSGGEFGPVGKIVSILSGLSLLFFSISGLWMYIQLYRGRLRKVDGGGKVRGGRWFWQ